MMLRAPPAWNQSICSGLKVWLASKSIVVPSGLWIVAPHRGVGRQVGEAVDADRVVLADLVVGGRVGEGERQQALLLQVRLVDAGEAAGQDHLGVAEPGLHGGVLAGAALAVVLVADGHPADAGLVEALGDLGERAGLAVERVLPRAGLARVGVDGAEEEVAGDVLEVAAVLEPRAGRRDVVGGALALRLQQDRQLDVVLAVPRARRPRGAGGGRCRGWTTTSTPEPSAGGAWKVSSPGSKPASGSAWPTGGSRRTSSPASLVSVSVRGSKSSVPASASAMTVSGLVTKLSVLALPSLRFGKLRL